MTTSTGPYKNLDRDIEAVVNNALGDSVTPSRLLELERETKFRRVFGVKPPNPPISWLDADEQPHYLFQQVGGLGVPEDQDGILDDEIETRSLFGTTLIKNPAVFIVTDQRCIFIYGSDSKAASVSIPLDSIDFIDSDKVFGGHTIDLYQDAYHFEYEVWPNNPYSSEFSDAISYLSNNITQSEEYTKYDFSKDEFTSAGDALNNQLDRFGSVFDEVNKGYVAKEATRGAAQCAVGGPQRAAWGFVIKGGAALYEEIYENLSDKASSVDAEDIDPQRTADIVTAYQAVGSNMNGSRTELASKVVGAAIAIDEQTAGSNRIPDTVGLDVDKALEKIQKGEKEDLPQTEDILNTEDLQELLKDEDTELL